VNYDHPVYQRRLARADASQREALLARAEAALAAARATEARAVLLAEATSDLAISLDVAGSLQRLARLAVPSLADWLVIDLADDNCRPVQVAMLHRNGMEDVLSRFTALQPHALTAQAPIMRILAGELFQACAWELATDDGDPPGAA
jgi:hypothetical protein